MEARQFIALVRTMRYWQRRYFAQKSRSDLLNAKQAEEAVDTWLKAYGQATGEDDDETDT